MIRYHNFDIVFAEIPDETTLAINLTGCPNRCPGCHSPHLCSDSGRVLDERELAALLRLYGRSVTCVCFMGGDADPGGVARLAEFVRREWPRLRVGWYSGRAQLPEAFRPAAFDYVKLATLPHRPRRHHERHHRTIPPESHLTFPGAGKHGD